MSTAFDILDGLETSLKPTLDPDIYVEPKDRHPWSEHVRQAEFIAFIRRHAKACRAYAVPNGIWMPSAKQRRTVAAEGLNPGEPDTGISWADAPTARPEFKNGTEMPDENQIETLNWYHRRGHPVAVVRTAEGCLAWLRSLGAPIPNIIEPRRGMQPRRGSSSPVRRQRRGK